MKKSFVILFLLFPIFVLAEVPNVNNLADGYVGRFNFHSVPGGITYRNLVNRQYNLTDTASANLLFPNFPESDKMPAMVIMHSSSGLGQNEYRILIIKSRTFIR